MITRRGSTSFPVEPATWEPTVGHGLDLAAFLEGSPARATFMDTQPAGPSSNPAGRTEMPAPHSVHTPANAGALGTSAGSVPAPCEDPENFPKAPGQDCGSRTEERAPARSASKPRFVGADVCPPAWVPVP